MPRHRKASREPSATSSKSTDFSSSHATVTNTESVSYSTTKSDDLKSKSLKKKVFQVWSGVVTAFQRTFKKSEKSGDKDYDDDSHYDTGAGDTSCGEELDSSDDGSGNKSDYEVIFTRKQSAGEVSVTQMPSLGEVVNRNSALEYEGVSSSRPRRRRSSRTRTRRMPIAPDAATATTTKKPGAMTSMEDGTHGNGSEVIANDSKVKGHHIQSTRLKAKQSGRSSQREHKQVKFKLDEAENEQEQDPKPQTQPGKHEPVAPGLVTVKTSSTTTTMDGGIQKLESGICIMYPKLPDPEDESHDTNSLPTSRHRKEHVRSSKQSDGLPVIRRRRRPERRFSLRDIGKPRAERGLRTELGAGFGLIFKKEKVVRRNTKMKIIQELDQTQVPMSTFIPDPEPVMMEIERPMQTIQRGVKAVINKYSEYKKAQLAAEYGGVPPVCIINNRDHDHNNESGHVPVSNVTKQIRPSLYNWSGPPAVSDLASGRHDLERKQKLLLDAALTLKSIDNICKQANVNGLPRNQQQVDNLVHVTPAENDVSSARSRRRNQDYIPSTPFTAQFAHLLPRPRHY